MSEHLSVLPQASLVVRCALSIQHLALKHTKLKEDLGNRANTVYTSLVVYCTCMADVTVNFVLSKTQVKYS